MFEHLGGTQIVRNDGHFGDDSQQHDTFELYSARLPASWVETERFEARLVSALSILGDLNQRNFARSGGYTPRHASTRDAGSAAYDTGSRSGETARRASAPIAASTRG